MSLSSSSNPRPHSKKVDNHPATHLPAPPRMSADHALSVTEVNGLLSLLIGQCEPLQHIWVMGEISGLKQVKNKAQWYFVLGDSKAHIPCVCFRTFPFNNGDAIRAKGSITFFNQQGRLQFQVSYAISQGAGSILAQRLLLKQTLQQEGVLTPRHTLPNWIQSVAIITAQPSAALADILVTLRQHAPIVSCLVIPTLMQGMGCVSDIIESLHVAQQQPCDVILIARGGGGPDDLLPYQDGTLCRAIHACERPVMTAIGHESDDVLVNAAATHAAPTPTAAAMRLAHPAYTLQQQLPTLLRDLHQQVHHHLRHTQQQAERLLTRIADGTHHQLKQTQAQTHSLLRVIDASSPLRKLQQGYSIVRNDSDTIVSSCHDLSKDDALRIQLRDGCVTTTVTQVYPTSMTP